MRLNQNPRYKLLTKNIWLILIISFTALFCLSYVAGENTSSLDISSTNIIFPKDVPGSTVYSQTIYITNNESAKTISISGDGFYDSESSGAQCPLTNKIYLTNFAYYAEIGSYSTLQDTRSDEEGYISIPDAFKLEDKQELILNHPLLNNENAIIKFRLSIPIPCYGGFDSGDIFLWFEDENGEIIRERLGLQKPDFKEPPQVFKCGNVSFIEDCVEEGRISNCNEPLIERRISSVEEGGNLYTWRYLFEGEQIHWDTLVIDYNGIENLEGVYGTVGTYPMAGNDIEVECEPSDKVIPLDSCNLREFEDEITSFNPRTMKYYDCLFTVETPDTMAGLLYVGVDAEDVDGFRTTMNESELTFLNPVISITVNDSIKFENLTHGKTAYSNEITLSSDVEMGSGVVMDMFISGTDFYSSEDFSYCPEKQKLNLDRFSYYAENGNYSTLNDLEIGRFFWPTEPQPIREKDEEGYINLGHSDAFARNFYDGFEIIQDGKEGAYYLGNQLNPDGEMKIKFKLDVPEQCIGNFSSGDIFFWGEAI